jgi:hypothetical protein
MAAPSNADYLNAINAGKNPGDGTYLPTGYSVLYSSTSDPTFAQAGLSGIAYVNDSTGQIIVAFRGPVTVSSGSNGEDETLANAAVGVNSQIANGDATVTSNMEGTVSTFMANVQSAAEGNGYSYSSDNVFLTGNSEGGFVAEVAGQSTGFGGTTFGAPGVPGYDGSGQPTNFTNCIEAADPVGNRATDGYLPPETGDQYHYGNDIFLGSQAASDNLANDYNNALNPPAGTDPSMQIGSLGNLIIDAGVDHPYAAYANSLGVTLNGPSSSSSVDISSMPDADLFLNNNNAYFGSINWDSAGNPTLSLTYTDGSTATVSIDTLSSGQYLYLYDQMLQNGQQGISGQVIDDPTTGQTTVGFEAGDGSAADVKTVNNDGETTGEVQFASNADGTTTVDSSGIYLASYTSDEQGPTSGAVGWSQSTGVDGSFVLANGQEVSVVNGSGQSIDAGGNDPGLVLDTSGNNTVTVADNSSATVIGNSDSLSAGSGSSISVNGNGDTIVLSASSSDALALAGDNDVVNSDGNSISLSSTSQATIDGTNNSITLDASSGSSLTIDGTGDTVTSQGNSIAFDSSNASLTIDGSGNTLSYSGTNDALAVNETDLASGESSLTDHYSVTDSAATLTSADLNFTDGSSELQTFDPSSAVSVEYQDYSGANETGTLLDQGTDFTAGGSQFVYYNPTSTITQETDNYTGADGTGTQTSADVNFTDGTSEQDLYNPSSGVDVEFQDYTAANEAGTLEYEGYNFTAGGSVIDYFNPTSTITQESDFYSGAYGAGTNTSTDYNYTDGTSEEDIYNPSASSTDEFIGWSAANETGTEEYEGNNLTSGGSSIEFFNPENGVSTETDSYNGAYGTGEITTADLALTNGFSLDYTISYDGSGNETGYAVNEYNPSDQLVWSGDYSADGTYLSGSSEYGYYGAGGYYGGSDGGYGGGYDFVKTSAKSNSSKGSNISEIAAHDDHHWVQPAASDTHTGRSDKDSKNSATSISHWDGSRPFSWDGGNVGQGGGWNGKHTRGGRGNDIGVIAAYDLAQSQLPAAQAAESARHQALTSADSNTPGSHTGSPFEGAKVQGNVITWSFASGAGTAAAPVSGAIGDQYKAAFEQAFQTWAAASGLTFKEVPDSTASDIRVGWGDFDTASSGVAGYTSYRQQNGVIQSGTIIRLEDPSQNALVAESDGRFTYSGTQAELNQVALHEIGHALGLADNADTSSIMYYASGASNRTLDQTDVANIRSLYGPAATGGNASMPTTPSAANRLADLLGSPQSLSSLLSVQNGPGGTTPNATITQMIQAMGTVHETGSGWADQQHTPLTPTPEPAITVASHPH